MLKLLKNLANYIMLSIPAITWVDVLEVILLTVMIYYVMLWIKNTKAWLLLRGVIVFASLILFAYIFRMNTILFIFEKLLSVGIIALVILFQPELRRALEHLGKNRVFGVLFSDSMKNGIVGFSHDTVNEIVDACFDMGKVKTGALITVENQNKLDDLISSGIKTDALVSKELLINIFEKNTPLHDGAIIITGDRVAAACCVLPLTEDHKMSKAFGTRHRAAVGMSETTDSVNIVVSEETGAVSMAMGGALSHNVNKAQLKAALSELVIEPKADKKHGFKQSIKNLAGRRKNGTEPAEQSREKSADREKEKSADK